MRRLALIVAVVGVATGVNASPAMATGTRVILRGSDYGRMLWGPGPQALYVFSRDRYRDSNCFGDCRRNWPPLLTEGKPTAGREVQQSLLGTIRRPNGKLQVTYNGKPLYTYANEGPGQVLCHNVYLNGGLWSVIGPNGTRRP